MTRKWSNQDLPGALHFVTGNVINRAHVFRQEACCRSFLKVCSDLRHEWPAKLIAYALMPDHIHLIVNPKDGRIREFTGALKSHGAREIIRSACGIDFRRDQPDEDGSVHQVWQESFKSQPLWSGWMIWQRSITFTQTPVRAGLVKSARDYKWSSFNAFYSTGTPAVLEVDKEWWWPDDVEKLGKAVKELGWKR
jgi:REP-associated tyrosine transposase